MMITIMKILLFFETINLLVTIFRTEEHLNKLYKKYGVFGTIIDAFFEFLIIGSFFRMDLFPLIAALILIIVIEMSERFKLEATEEQITKISIACYNFKSIVILTVAVLVKGGF